MDGANGQFSDADFILRQAAEEYKKMKFGRFGSVAKNGCGAIAAYNMLLANGIALPLERIIAELRSRLGLALGGLLGTRAVILWLYLRKYLRVRPGFCFPYALKRFRGCNSVIIMYFWRSKARLGAHFISGVRAEDGKFDFYNYQSGVYRSELCEFIKATPKKHELPFLIIGAKGCSASKTSAKRKSENVGK